MTPFTYLSDDDLAGLGITPPELADAIEQAIAEVDAGQLHTTPKSAILPGGGRYMMSTLAVGDYAGLTVLKTVSVCPENPGKGLPAITGAIVALDAQTGQLRAVLGADWITAHRTAALSAVAARRLADPASSVVAFVGCGVQARSHLDAFAAMFPLTEVRAFGRGQANARALCDKAAEMGLRAVIADSAEDALRGADLVVTSVTLDYSIAPFLDTAWLKPGAFAAITDLGIPWLANGWDRFANIVIDDNAQEASSKKKLCPPELVSADLAELVLGHKVLARDPARPSAFAFRGIALGDFAATALVLERAKGQR